MLMVALPQVSLALGASKSQATVHSTVLFGTQVIVGGVVFTIVTVWLQSAWIGRAHVCPPVPRSAKMLSSGSKEIVTVLRMLTVALPQVSLALGASKYQSTVHSTV